MSKTDITRNAKIVAFINRNIQNKSVIVAASKEFNLTTSTIYHVCHQNNITLPKVISTRIDPETHDTRGVHPCLLLGLVF